jgi:hypothetical protein
MEAAYNDNAARTTTHGWIATSVVFSTPGVTSFAQKSKRTDLTFEGGADDVFVIATGLTCREHEGDPEWRCVKNIFWQVAGYGDWRRCVNAGILLVKTS